MGPPFFDGGNIVLKQLAATKDTSFNGAAVF